ncbi:MAG: UDP-N-acetylmuramate dehydrogenase [PVC group bacterium]|nr:UDP-N-acetylmuramate dehydrogenase [PVC group bacterium]
MNTIYNAELDQKIKQFFKGAVKVSEPLAAYTSLKIGGRAELFFSPVDVEDISALLKILGSTDLRIDVIGAGTNLLIDDADLPAAVIKLDNPSFKNISLDDDRVYAGAGAALGSLIEFSKQNGLTGCEFLVGIPGTVGGALVMNAGVRNVWDVEDKPYLSMSDIIEQVQVMDQDGNIRIYSHDQLKFEYRSSNLKGCIVLGGWFSLRSEQPGEIQQTIDAFWRLRKKTQAVTMPNAGCVFKNPDGSHFSAGELIEDCSLKGMVFGNVQVSPVHANYIVNKGGAGFGEMKELIMKVQQAVWQKFKIELEPEIEIWEGSYR